MSWRSSLKTRVKQRKLQQQNQKTLNKKWRFAILATFFNYAIWPIWFDFQVVLHMESSLPEAAAYKQISTSIS